MKEFFRKLLFGDGASSFSRRGVLGLVLLAALLVLCTLGDGTGGGFRLSREEERLWDRVRAAQAVLVAERDSRGIVSPKEVDPWGTGLIGLEWSAVTTTLGDLEAKRTSCDPRWAVRVLRWLKEAGLAQGDRVAILSSASFPGFLLAALAAAEEMGLSVLLAPSLAASTWGANVPELLLPDLLTLLRRRGLLRTAPAFCTLGGDGETGGGLAAEGVALLRESARRNGIPLLEEERLEMMVAEKTRRVLDFDPELVVQIGGSHANLGTDPEVTLLPGGLHFPEVTFRGDGGETSSRRMPVPSYGNGVLGKLAGVGLPVIHLLNVRDLARRNGIPFDEAPERKGPATRGRLGAVVGLVAFASGLALFSRWELE